MTVRILVGDCVEVLRGLPDESVHCVVTSPPYWGLRDYGVEGQLGLEPTLGAHIEAMVGVFREVRRVLRSDGTVWLNYGDCYATSPNGRSAADTKAAGSDDRTFRDKPFSTVGPIYDPAGGPRGDNKGGGQGIASGRVCAGGVLKPKDLCMVPNRLAIALQEDGWWVRSEVVWGKPNPMPDSSGDDRPGTAHEKIWKLTKNGDRPLFWKHPDGRAAVSKPAPDYIWTHKKTGEKRADDPGDAEHWRRRNLWKGRDYYYDAEAVRQESSYPCGPNAPDKIRSPHGQGFTRRAAQKVPSGWATDGPHNARDHYNRVAEVRGRQTYGRHTLGDKVPGPERRDRKYEGDGNGGGVHRPHKGLQAARDDAKAKRAEPPRHAQYETGHRSLDSAPRVEGRYLRNYEPAPLAVWRMATRPFPEAHFATFPPELAERAILAGTSAGGVCAACGAPRHAVWSAPEPTGGRGSGNKQRNAATQGERSRTNTHLGSSVPWQPTAKRLRRWTPSCDCDAGTVPAVVLDPFAGSGTTGLVADQLQRDAILIELNPEYADMARARIERDAGLLAAVTG